jgi:peptidoglycan/LPS O-acetylase OafA/YrhL
MPSEPAAQYTKSSLPSTPASRGQIPSLDGLRAISFMIVFAAHAGLDKLVPGGFGVTIFFFLSGFLITTLLRSEYDRNGSVNLKHFWLRRALRILPPFYIILILAVALALLLDPPGTLGLDALTWQALHVSNYWIIRHGFATQAAGTDVYWSLAVEEHFYLLFPWLYVAMRRCAMPAKAQAQLLWCLCAVVLTWRIILTVGLGSEPFRTYLATDTRVDSILFGCALAVWNNPVLDAAKSWDRVWKRLVLPLSLVVLLFCLVYRNPVFRETARYSLQGIALTGVFIVAIRCHDWWPFRLLNTRPMTFLGVLSYSLYLIHYVVLQAFYNHASGMNAAAIAALGFAISLLIALILYRVVERPCAKLRKNLKD